MQSKKVFTYLNICFGSWVFIVFEAKVVGSGDTELHPADTVPDFKKLVVDPDRLTSKLTFQHNVIKGCNRHRALGKHINKDTTFSNGVGRYCVQSRIFFKY